MLEFFVFNYKSVQISVSFTSFIFSFSLDIILSILGDMIWLKLSIWDWNALYRCILVHLTTLRLDAILLCIDRRDWQQQVKGY